MHSSASSEVRLQEIEGLAAQGFNLIPIFRRVLADELTPALAFRRLCPDGHDGFLLESVEGGEHLARYSFVAADPRAVITMQAGEARTGLHRESFTDPLTLLRDALGRHRVAPVPGLPRFSGGLVGYLGFEAAGYFERLPAAAGPGVGLPEISVCLVDTMLVFDHLLQTLTLLSHVRLDGSDGSLAEATQAALARIEEMAQQLGQPTPALDWTPSEQPMQSNLGEVGFSALVERAREYILAGDVFQVVLSQRFSGGLRAHPFEVYRRLRALNPSPYMYFLRLGQATILGTSPEMLVRVQGGVAETRPLAGTRPRGRGEAEDQAAAADLLADEKERAEHVMLVDLGRNDLGRVSIPGGVRVDRLMGVERYSHVMHLVSELSGTLRSECDGLDALRACFPAGTLSGAPKIRAMEIIAELEPAPRGPYGGALGYIGFDGALDMAITLRSLVVKGDTVHLQAGAGIVADSDPRAEYQETLAKAEVLFEALRRADSGAGAIG